MCRFLVCLCYLNDRITFRLVYAGFSNKSIEGKMAPGDEMRIKEKYPGSGVLKLEMDL
jgi:hypothetical protein